MNKRGLIKFIIVFATAFLSFYFMIVTSESGFESMFNEVMLLNFMLSVTIFMYSNKNQIKKFKFGYDVILMILMLFSILYFLDWAYNYVACLFSVQCGIESESTFTMIYPVFLFLMVMFSFKDIFNKTDKTNDILTIIISIIIIFIHLRYYLDPNWSYKLLSDENTIQTSYHFVVQNYIYFIVMYLVVLVHHRVNKPA